MFNTRAHLLLAVLVITCLIFSNGYVLDHRPSEGSRQRPTTPRAPVKTNEESEEDNDWGVMERWGDTRDRLNGVRDHVTPAPPEKNFEEREPPARENLPGLSDQLWEPSRFQSHFQLGPGFTFNISSGMNTIGGSGGPWWTGPHVCVNVEEKTESRNETSRGRGRHNSHHRLIITYFCDENEAIRKCVTVQSRNDRTTTNIKTYKCCEGYERDEDTTQCIEKIERVDLISTLEQLSATEMVRALALTTLTSRIQSSNYTVFAPSNQAFDKYNKQDGDVNVVVINEAASRLIAELNPVMTSHVVPGFIKMSAVQYEQLLETENPEAKIRINKYIVRGRQRQLITANCAPISQTNVKASNGIVHVIDSVMQPATQDIKSIIRADPTLSIMSRVLELVDLDTTGHYTVLVPTDEAFQKLSQVIKDKILNGHTCGKDVIKHHILPYVICSAVVDGRVRVRNVLNSHVTMSRDEQEKILVETSRVLKRDVMATNGVIHVIDDVILPAAASDVLDAIQKSGATTFLDLLRSTQLDRDIVEMENFTLFVPSNKALQEAGLTKSEESRGREDVMKVLSAHMVSGVIRGSGLYHGRRLNATRQGTTYAVQDYLTFSMGRSSVKSVQCSPIIRTDINTCDAVIHVADKVIIPPVGDVLDILQKNSTFSDLLALIRQTDLTNLLSSNQRPFTIFAPTNQAFRALPADTLNELRGNTAKARRVLLSHMLPDIRCCSGIFPSNIFQTYEFNMDGWMISLDKSRSQGGRARYGATDVSACDLTATNGVVHAIDSFSSAVLRSYASRESRTEGRRERFRFNLDDLWKSSLACSSGQEQGR